MRTHGICPRCGLDGVLPGRANNSDDRPVCLTCAGIPGRYRCRTCQRDGELHRRGQCARCALRDDLTALMVNHAADPAAMTTVVEIFCSVDRPESILTWKRSPKVHALLTGLSSGEIALSHDGLDTAGSGRHVSHLRSLLDHHGLLPQRDEPLARFEAWLTTKLDAVTEPAARATVEQFATWHHLRWLRRNSTPGQSSEGPKRSAKQEITETIKFLTWLHDTHHRTAATCSQQDVEEYLTSGPTTRHSIRASGSLDVLGLRFRGRPLCLASLAILLTEESGVKPRTVQGAVPPNEIRAVRLTDAARSTPTVGPRPRHRARGRRPPLKHLMALSLTVVPPVRGGVPDESSRRTRLDDGARPEVVMDQVVQIVGALLIRAQRSLLTPSSRVYLALNLVGSGVVSVIAAGQMQYGFLMLEGVWAVVSAMGLLK
jgi:hypothetical protein